MEEKENKRTFPVILLFTLIVGGYFSYGLVINKINSKDSSVINYSVTPTIALSDYITYKGKTGKNALEILKNNASVEQDGSGMVAAINNRKANTSSNEYWAFYVNGELANVGPLQYQTKDGDLIEWKIEKY